MIGLRPAHAGALNNRGTILHELGRFDEAIASYEKVIALEPNYVDALYNRGVTLQALKRFEEALACYDRVLTFKPAYVGALNNRSVTLQNLGRTEEAQVSYDRVVATQSNDLKAIRLALRTFVGPNLFVPFAAVMAEFSIPAPPAVTSGTFGEPIQTLLPDAMIARISALDPKTPFEQLVAMMAELLHGWHGPSDLPYRAERTPSGRGRLFLGYDDPKLTAEIAGVAVYLAWVGYSRMPRAVEPNSMLASRINGLGEILRAYRPTGSSRALMRIARANNIPYYPITPNFGVSAWKSRVVLAINGKPGSEAPLASELRLYVWSSSLRSFV